jgi:hypothetical protein
MLLLGALLLSSCGSVRLSEELHDEASVLGAIGRHYDGMAIEEQGLCTHPVMDGVRGYDVLEQSADELVMEVRYSYSDPTANLRRRRRTTVRKDCTRWATRTFWVVKAADGYQVTRMTGEQGIGIRTNRMLTPGF